MKLITLKTSPPPYRFLLFPLFSFLLHLSLFLIFGAIPDSKPDKTEEDIIVAIVDLDTLLPPEPLLSEPEIEESETAPPEKFSLDEPEMEEAEPEPAPEPEPIDLAQLTGGVIAPPPPAVQAEPLADEPPPDLGETLAEEILEPEPEVEEAPPEEELPPEEPEPIEEVVEAPEPEPEPAPPEEAPEEVVEEVIEEAPEEEPVVPQEVAEPVEAPVEEPPAEPVSEPAPEPEPSPETPTEEAPEKVMMAAAEEPIEKQIVEEEKPKPPPPPPPPPKPSKEKIKKIGLLGLLKKGDKKITKNRPLLAKRFPRKKRALKKPKEQKSDFRPAGTEQRIARLKKDVLGSEQQRLMKRQTMPGRRRSEIEIVQGAGRNYNVVSSSIQKKSNGLATVYSSLLQSNPNLQGNVLVEFEISPKGKVTKVTILTSSLGHPQFEAKLVQEIMHWTFRPTEKGKTTVLYPLSFFPSG